jgi:mono/diheme cytochrome c family protein
MSTSLNSRRAFATRTICTALLLLVLLGVGASVWAFSGFVGVAATDKDNALVAWFLHTTYQRSLDRQSSAITVPDDLVNDVNVRAGAHLYAQHCVYCHGAPGVRLDPIGAGISPRAPDLLAAKRHNGPQSTFWVMRHGVKMTAMAAFGKSLDDSQLWQLAAFLRARRGIDADGYRALTAPEADASGDPSTGRKSPLAD